MSEFSGRPQYDDPQSDEDDAVADSGTEMAYRRLAAASGAPTTTRLVFHNNIMVFPMTRLRCLYADPQVSQMTCCAHCARHNLRRQVSVAG